MTTEFLGHPAFGATEELQRPDAAAAAAAATTSTTMQYHNPSIRPHRRHNSASRSAVAPSSGSSFPTAATTAAAVAAVLGSTAKFTTTRSASQKTLPDRTKFANADDDDDDDDDEVARACVDDVVADDDDDDDEDLDLDLDYDDDHVDRRIARDNNTKDCVHFAPSVPPPLALAGVAAGFPASRDETDHLQYRFGRGHHAAATAAAATNTHANTHPSSSSRQHDYNDATTFAALDGSISGLSSALSSPSPSTVSSALSTPTRLSPQHSHRHCCRQSTAGSALSSLPDDGCDGGGDGGDDGGGGAGDGGAGGCVGVHDGDGCAAGNLSSSSLTLSAFHHQHRQQEQEHEQQEQQQHHHHHHNNHHHPQHNNYHHNIHDQHLAGATGGCKKSQKLDPRQSPSPYRQLLPIALCILSFATVFSLLMVYMDTTEIRHKQFRLKMSRDYDLDSVAQDDPTLIAFLREFHMRKYPMHFLKNARDTPGAEQQHLNFSGARHDELTPRMAHYVADLVGGKMNGAVIQSLPGSFGQLMTAPWLSETLNWAGVIVEPEPRRFFTLRKQNAQRARLQVVHACVSPNPYPKEVTIHNEESEVRIKSLLDEETSWFNSRVKCFPLYTIMLACDRVEYDLLSLGVHGHELEILQTLPFDKIKIEVISIHLPDDMEDVRGYLQAITKFLVGKSYKFQKNFGRNYFYQRINSTSRTRRKDILLLKTP